MTLKQRTKNINLFLLFLTAGTLNSCSPASAKNDNDDSSKLCAVELQQTPAQTVFMTEASVSYSGSIPSDCKQKTSSLSGRVQINVAAQSSVSSPSISLRELKAGNRNLQFDASSDNFIRGTYEKRFDSSFYPDWRFPWSDAPSVITLSMDLADQTLSSALPQKVYVELIY